MDEDNKASDLVVRASEGDQEAVTRLWLVLYPRVRRAVAARMTSLPQLIGDTSDIASESLQALFRKIEEGGLPELAGMNNLWGLLRTIAIRRVNDRRKSLLAVRRGAGARHFELRDEDLLLMGEAELLAEFRDLVNCLLNALPDDLCRAIVGLRLRGASVADIAELTQLSVRSVKRRMLDIETIWNRVSERGYPANA